MAQNALWENNRKQKPWSHELSPWIHQKQRVLNSRKRQRNRDLLPRQDLRGREGKDPLLVKNWEIFSARCPIRKGTSDVTNSDLFSSDFILLITLGNQFTQFWMFRFLFFHFFPINSIFSMYKGTDFRFLSASRLTCADDSYRRTPCKSNCSPSSLTELNFPRMLHFLLISFGELLLYSWDLSEWKLLLKAKELFKKKSNNSSLRKSTEIKTWDGVFRQGCHTIYSFSRRTPGQIWGNLVLHEAASGCCTPDHTNETNHVEHLSALHPEPNPLLKSEVTSHLKMPR